ncbi:hypothetical protein C9374_011356 [Naegleria lovaniensis]|uniref:Uncharacterized protein n=1 Tax=Naegleria lovaniensis TaxID=51637 RepID=A0AA88KQP6_NAELO|nr:uncharacterized protein C9374_011356 [Naegleria lovaniensis]KAG2392631.1 hypothetical protein C9374_011356 [Naegleria lovaniensis]
MKFTLYQFIPDSNNSIRATKQQLSSKNTIGSTTHEHKPTNETMVMEQYHAPNGSVCYSCSFPIHEAQSSNQTLLSSSNDCEYPNSLASPMSKANTITSTVFHEITFNRSGVFMDTQVTIPNLKRKASPNDVWYQKQRKIRSPRLKQQIKQDEHISSSECDSYLHHNDKVLHVDTNTVQETLHVLQTPFSSAVGPEQLESLKCVKRIRPTRYSISIKELLN